LQKESITSHRHHARQKNVQLLIHVRSVLLRKMSTKRICFSLAILDKVLEISFANLQWFKDELVKLEHFRAKKSGEMFLDQGADVATVD